MKRPAFTLVEFIIATSITCLIAAGVFMFFSGSGRLSKDAYETVSAAMNSRIERERSIFRSRLPRENPYLPCGGSHEWGEER